jgi:hypothetical protein
MTASPDECCGTFTVLPQVTAAEVVLDRESARPAPKVLPTERASMTITVPGNRHSERYKPLRTCRAGPARHVFSRDRALSPAPAASGRHACGGYSGGEVWWAQHVSEEVDQGHRLVPLEIVLERLHDIVRDVLSELLGDPTARDRHNDHRGAFAALQRHVKPFGRQGGGGGYEAPEVAAVKVAWNYGEVRQLDAPRSSAIYTSRALSVRPRALRQSTATTRTQAPRTIRRRTHRELPSCPLHTRSLRRTASAMLSIRGPAGASVTPL